MANARRTTNINPLARRSLAALSAEVSREELPLRSQLRAAEALVRKAKTRGQAMSLESALADIAAAQVQRQRNRAARAK